MLDGSLKCLREEQMYKLSYLKHVDDLLEVGHFELGK